MSVGLWVFYVGAGVAIAVGHRLALSGHKHSSLALLLFAVALLMDTTHRAVAEEACGEAPYKINHWDGNESYCQSPDGTWERLVY
jgi:hypothetical protein